ncbi:MAG: calcium-binding protein, partial [Acetobacteraceae bacterium]
EISQNLPDGGFQFQPGSLPPGSSITFFGAIGGLVVSDAGTASYYPTIAGTNYVDALTLNTALGRPDEVSNVSVAQGPVFIHGFAGDDLIYGSNGKDRLYGDDGNDTLYSFASAANSGGDDAEQVSGGAGDDFLYGGDSLGIFDGGDGNDTFGVIAGQGELVMQVEIDLTAGYAAENPNGVTNGPAPVGDTAPFDSKLVRNQYTLTSIENAIGGPLNDWIKAASGSTIEGGPGADYLDAKAGNVTLSYASSSSEVVVDLYPGGSQTNLGDATGDVIGYNDVTNVAALIGSANDDTLGAWIEEGSFTFTGNGGSDLFQILGYTLNDQLPMYFITDFTREAGETDVIDLRQFGTPSFDYLTINGNVIGVSAVAGGIIDVQITLENFSQAITPDDFLFAGGSAPGSAAPSVDGSDPSGGADVEIDENGGACFSPDHRFCRGGGPGGAWDHAAGHSGKDWFAANPGWRCDG